MLWALLLLPLLAWPAGDELELLAEGGRWDELRVLAEERLAADAGDGGAHYWLGRDLLAQALSLSLSDRISRDIARSLLERARLHFEQLGRSPDFPDAEDWRLEVLYARHRIVLAVPGTAAGFDTDLELELERGWSESGRALAAFLRGLLAEERGDEDAAAWYARASDAAPQRSRFAQRRATALALQGRRGEALEAFDVAAAADDAWLPDLLATLQSILPARRDAAERSRRLELLAQRPPWRRNALLAWHRAHALKQLGDDAGWNGFQDPFLSM